MDEKTEAVQRAIELLREVKADTTLSPDNHTRIDIAITMLVHESIMDKERDAERKEALSKLQHCMFNFSRKTSLDIFKELSPQFKELGMIDITHYLDCIHARFLKLPKGPRSDQDYAGINALVDRMNFALVHRHGEKPVYVGLYRAREKVATPIA